MFVKRLGNSQKNGSHDAKEFAESRQLQVACFKRRPVRCAEWLPHQDGYKYTSTGGTIGCEMFLFPNVWALGSEGHKGSQTTKK